jgi:hypothetical protein
MFTGQPACLRCIMPLFMWAGLHCALPKALREIACDVLHGIRWAYLRGHQPENMHHCRLDALRSLMPKKRWDAELVVWFVHSSVVRLPVQRDLWHVLWHANQRARMCGTPPVNQQVLPPATPSQRHALMLTGEATLGRMVARCR